MGRDTRRVRRGETAAALTAAGPMVCRRPEPSTGINRMTAIKNVNGNFYPPFHPGWGGFAEELFHYTSRYYLATEAFLRSLSQDREFSMRGYKAAMLSEIQRDLMAAILSTRPDPRSASAAMSVVSAVIRRAADVERAWLDAYCEHLQEARRHKELVEHSHHVVHEMPAVSPLDPFLNIAERLQMPAAVRDRHVEVCMHTLARHLDSPSSALRTNLRNAVVQLHSAGYVLRNHPHLTHSEAEGMGDAPSV